MKYTLYLLRRGMTNIGLILTFLVLMTAATAVFAQLRPPQELLKFIGTLALVHDEKCDIKSQNLKAQECLIYAANADTIFIVLFTDDQSTITQIIFANRQEEKVLWSGAI